MRIKTEIISQRSQKDEWIIGIQCPAQCLNVVGAE